MKIFLFISYLWILAVSQMIYANSQTPDYPLVPASTPAPRTVASLTALVPSAADLEAEASLSEIVVALENTDGQSPESSAFIEKAFCRENVSREKVFPEADLVEVAEMGCDDSYYLRQLAQSEDRERLEYSVWSTLAPVEMNLSHMMSEPISSQEIAALSEAGL